MTETIKKWNLALPIGIISVFLVIGVIAGVYFLAPSNYLSLDVNPSIEFQTNRLNNVVSINPVNEDAKKIMAGYELTDKNLEVVIKNIVDRMILNGYIAPDKDNQILITTQDKNAAPELSQDVNDILTTYLNEKQLNANLIQQSIKVSSKDIENAHENSISAGKMALIEKLIQSDSSLTLDELSKTRVSDLITLAKTKNINLDGLIDETNDKANVNDEQGDVNNVDDKNVNDDQSDSNNVDDKKVNDNQSDSNNVDDKSVNDDQSDSNNVDDKKVNDEQGNINNADDKNVNNEQGNISNELNN